MAFGNFGGLGLSFPARFNTPQSQQVMTDPEWDTSWQSKLAGIPQTLASSNSVQAYAGGDGYDPAKAAPYQADVARESARYKLLNSGASTGAITDDILNEYVAKMGGVQGTLVNNGMGGYLSDFGRGGSAVVETGTTYAENPAYGAAFKQYTQEKDQRAQNQTAQQQAYNSMLGNGQQNAVMGANYSAPGFGQVNGQTADPFAAPAVPGVDPSWSSGVYNPSGTYAPQTKQNSWGL